MPSPFDPALRVSRRTALATLAGAGASLAVPGLHHAIAAGLRAPAIDKDTLVVGLERSFANLDASVAVTSDSDRYNWQIYDTLYGFDASGNLTPRLATSVDVAEDGLAYRYHLRPGVKFHDGQTVTAEDVRFSIEHILKPEIKSTRRPHFAAVLDKVETPDPLTVVFRLKTPDGAFPNKVAGYLPIMPRTFDPSKTEAEFFTFTPVSAGPYKVKTFNRDGLYLELERFEDYWDRKPNIRRLIFKVITEAGTRTNALLSGEIDVAVGLPYQYIDRVRGTADFEVIASPVGSPLIVKPYANVPDYPVSKREVRQALSYAVDTKAIIANVLHGAGEPLATIISRYYPYGADPTLQAYPYDPKKAKELLAKAGYPNGFETKLYAANDRPKEIAESVAAYWSQVGVKTTVQQVDYATWVSLNNTHKVGPLTVQQMANAIYDPVHPVVGLFSKNGTWGDYYNPEVQALIDEVIAVQGPEARGALFRKIGRLLHEDAGAIYLSELYQVYARKKSVAWEPQKGTGILNFREVGWR